MTNTIEIPDHSDVHARHVLSIAGRRYKVGHVPAGASARQVQDGPMVPGPWAYVFELASVLDDNGGSGAESIRMRSAGTEHVIGAGDRVKLGAHTYEIVIATASTWHVRKGDVSLRTIE